MAGDRVGFMKCLLFLNVSIIRTERKVFLYDGLSQK